MPNTLSTEYVRKQCMRVINWQSFANTNLCSPNSAVPRRLLAVLRSPRAIASCKGPGSFMPASAPLEEQEHFTMNKTTPVTALQSSYRSRCHGNRHPFAISKSRRTVLRRWCGQSARDVYRKTDPYDVMSHHCSYFVFKYTCKNKYYYSTAVSTVR